MNRPLHAAVLPPGPRLLRALADALDGGPAICPLPPGLPRPALGRLLDALAPDAGETPDGIVPHDPRGGRVPAADGTAPLVAPSGPPRPPHVLDRAGAPPRHSADGTLAPSGAAPGDP